MTRKSRDTGSDRGGKPLSTLIFFNSEIDKESMKVNQLLQVLIPASDAY